MESWPAESLLITEVLMDKGPDPCTASSRHGSPEARPARPRAPS
ncbi:MAG: hypothetical protein DLM66_04140 [Candidatus Dormiibacter spiritus]|nr:MAG: hypothetical protein DLM66_04140 [Candidatus Dormibacteraeota bacterium]